MIWTFLESPTDLDVHPGKRFALFGQNRRNWLRRNKQQKQRNLLFCSRTIYSPTMFLHWLHLFTLCWHTRDNVRLSDVVKFALCGPDRRGSSPADDNSFIFLTFWYVMHYFFPSHAQIWRNRTKNWRKRVKKTRLSFLVSRHWRDALRHVWGHTNHRTTMVHTFLESPSNLDVHLEICF